MGIKLLSFCDKQNILIFEIDNQLYKAKVNKIDSQFFVYIYNFNKNFIINLNNKFLPTSKTEFNKTNDFVFEKQIKSPLNGKVIKINVTENQFIKKNETLVVIESMKMENEIRASSDAFIKSIPICTGDLIKQNQVIIFLEKREKEDAIIKNQNDQKAIQDR